MDSNDKLAGSRRRFLHIFNFHHLGSAEFKYANCLNRAIPLLATNYWPIEL